MISPAPTHLSRFLPGALARWSARASARPTRSFSEAYVGALMITDLSGFTRLTARLTAEQGPLGVERTSRILNTYVALIVEIVGEVGGTVLSFEGDALVAGWRCTHAKDDMALAAQRACHCAALLRTRVEGRVIEGESFQLRSGVSVGQIELIHLVLAPDDRRLLLAGACMREVSRCATLAESGQVLVSGCAWSLLQDRATGLLLGADCAELSSVEPPLVGEDPTPQPLFIDTLDLDAYLPAMLRARPDWATSDWLAELRTVSTLFARITANALPDDLDLTDAAMRILHREVGRHQGEVLRIAICEGGLLAIAGFGLPERAHHDDPARAVLCALALAAEIPPRGAEVSVSIATGDVFCGALGTAEMAEYTVLGNSVNRAARLAVVAAGRVLTDLATAERAAQRVEFRGPYRMNVPGLRTALPVYVAHEPRAVRNVRLRQHLVDRKEEYEQLLAWLDRPADMPTMALIEGEAGVGKSALLEAILEEARERGLTVLTGSASDIEQRTPYFAFRQIIATLAGPREAGPEAVKDRLARLISGSPEQFDFLPLLDNVVDLGLPPNAVCDRMSGSARAENLRRLLRTLITEALSPAGVLAIEDAHWLDTPSQLLIGDLLTAEPPFSVLVTARGGSFAWEAAAHRIELAPLAQDHAAELARTLLGMAEMATRVRDALWSRAGGNPFFVSELCRALTTGKAEGNGTMTVSEERLFALPQSARAAVLSRTDLLPAPDLLVLKIASALSTGFRVQELAAVRVLERIRSQVVDCVTRLVSLHLLRQDGEEAERYKFSHAITQEAVYWSMVSEQRRDAHAAIAEALETDAPGREAELLPVILSHWQRAENEAKTCTYLARVAQLRLHQFDNAAAMALAESYLARAPLLAQQPGAGELAALHLVRGEAALNLGRMTVAREALEQGLALLGRPLPQSRPGLIVGLLEEATRHLKGAARLRGGLSMSADRPLANGGNDDERLLAAARAHEHLTQIYYFQGDKARLIHATLRAANLAEQASHISTELAVNYASLGAICGVIPLRRRAERYLGLALQLSERLADRAAAARIHLLAGLYETSIGAWERAQDHFEGALATSAQLGEMRRWCELAVSLETILNPGLLTAIFPGAPVWASLVEATAETARERGDLQVLGCALTSAVRGYLALGQPECADVYLSQLEELMRSQPGAIEPINALEAAIRLEEAAGRRGDEAEQAAWLRCANDLLQGIRPAMKSRTLPALTTAFISASRDGGDDRSPSAAHRRSLARDCVAKLARFAKAYPIGTPRAHLFRGDLEASDGRGARAAASWRSALHAALNLGMYADSHAAWTRLQEAGAATAADRSLWADRAVPILEANPTLAGAMEHAAVALACRRNGAGHDAR